MTHQKKILITGCHRSGTTLLSSMIGMHPDIALVNEDYYESHARILSKKYVGTKAVIPSIHKNRKRSLLYTSFYRKYLYIRRKLGMRHARNFLPYCIDDFDKVVFIHRSFTENVKSIIKRTNVSINAALQDVICARQVQQDLTGKENVFFLKLSDLTSSPEVTMMGICSFLDIEYHPKMLSGFAHTPEYRNSKIEVKK